MMLKVSIKTSRVVPLKTGLWERVYQPLVTSMMTCRESAPELKKKSSKTLQAKTQALIKQEVNKRNQVLSLEPRPEISKMQILIIIPTKASSITR
jgi:hypothetical protein